MKGKGKGDRNGGKDKQDEKECPLSFPDLTPMDHTRLCPLFTSILNRDENACIAIEEVDALQVETESLLQSATQRMHIIKQEIQILNGWGQAATDSPSPATPTSKGKGSGKGTASTPNESSSGKRSSTGKDERPSKKLKESSSSSGKGSKGSSKGKVQKEKEKSSESKGGKNIQGTPKSSRGKNDAAIKQEPVIKQECDLSGAESPPPSSPLSVLVPPLTTGAAAAGSGGEEAPKLKVDVPNRFWSIVEPYCGDITIDDMKVLEDLIRGYEEDKSEYYKIPPLGKHYADKWARQDLINEQTDNGGKLLAAAGGGKTGGSSDGNSILKKDDDSPFGPLTQRLVQALMEESILPPIDTEDLAATEAASISPKSLARQLNIGNPTALERKIKGVLEENGILDSEDEFAGMDTDTDDEILTELRKNQQELKSLSQHTLISNKRMYKQAKDEMAKQELWKRMAQADNDVMEAYRKLQAVRAKKKSPSKKELEIAKKTLKEREAIVKQLESI